MTNPKSAILSALTIGSKSRAQIASELSLPPSEVAGALVSLVYTGQVVVSGKTRVGGKDVSVYTISDGVIHTTEEKLRPVKRDSRPAPLDSLSDEAVTSLLNSNLYQIWGGYALVDTPQSKGLAVRRHTES